LIEVVLPRWDAMDGIPTFSSFTFTNLWFKWTSCVLLVFSFPWIFCTDQCIDSETLTFFCDDSTRGNDIRSTFFNANAQDNVVIDCLDRWFEICQVIITKTLGKSQHDGNILESIIDINLTSQSQRKNSIYITKSISSFLKFLILAWSRDLALARVPISFEIITKRRLTIN
jgi:hypothetical protein